MKLKIAAAVMAISVLWSAPVLANDNDTWIGDDTVAMCEEIGMKNHVCPEILEAIIEMESSGQANAVNGTCKGLMQVSDNVHAGRMQRLGVTNLYDKRQNIITGCDILLELYETYGDNSYEILSRYNGWADIERRKAQQDWPYYARHIVDRARELECIHGKLL